MNIAQSLSKYPTKNTIKINLNNKHIAIVLLGGLGDAIMLTPLIKWIKKNYENVRIDLAIRPIYKKCLEGNPNFRVVNGIKLVQDKEVYGCYEHVLDFGKVINGNPKAEQMNAIDAHFLYFDPCFDLSTLTPKDKIPQLYISDERKKLAKEWFNRMELNDRITIGLQLRASSWVRTYPPDKNRALALSLGEQGFNVVLFAESYNDIFTGPNIYHAPFQFTRNHMENVIALANQCDILVSPDSCFVQIAQALDKSIVCLYGAFPKEFRVCNNKAIVIECDKNKFKCSPCFDHRANCVYGIPSPCMDSIEVEDIINMIYSICQIKKYGINQNKYCKTIDYPHNVNKITIMESPENFGATASPFRGVWSCFEPKLIAQRIKSAIDKQLVHTIPYYIADMGCGDGTLLNEFDNKEYMKYGIDILFAAKTESYNKYGVDLWKKVLTRDIKEWNIWEDGKINCLIYNEILEHQNIYDAIEILKVAKIYLHKMGIAYILYDMDHQVYDVEKLLGMQNFEILENNKLENNKHEIIVRKEQCLN